MERIKNLELRIMNYECFTFRSLLFAIFILCFFVFSMVDGFAENKAQSPSKKLQYILTAYNKYLVKLKYFTGFNYTYTDEKLIDQVLVSILDEQNRVYIAIKSPNLLHTKYTSLSIKEAFKTMNDVGLGTLNTELDIIHQMSRNWKNSKRVSNKERGAGNLMLWHHMDDRLAELWKIYYSWDQRTSKLVRNTDLFPKYCLLSKTMERILAEHKLALRVLYDKWVLDRSNILYSDYATLEFDGWK